MTHAQIYCQLTRFTRLAGKEWIGKGYTRNPKYAIAEGMIRDFRLDLTWDKWAKSVQFADGSVATRKGKTKWIESTPVYDPAIHHRSEFS